MTLLLDTHVVLWWLDDPALVGHAAREQIRDPENVVLVSAAVAWEIAIKRRLGKLSAPENLEAAVADCGFDFLPITASHALRTESLPDHHRDPFDRLLIAQAVLEDATLVTSDAAMTAYGISLLNA